MKKSKPFFTFRTKLVIFFCLLFLLSLAVNYFIIRDMLAIRGGRQPRLSVLWKDVPLKEGAPEKVGAADPKRLSLLAEGSVSEALLAAGITDGDIESSYNEKLEKDGREWIVYRRKIGLPAGISRKAVLAGIMDKLQGTGLELTGDGAKTGDMIVVGRQGLPLYYLELAVKGSSKEYRAAVILDDGGYTYPVDQLKKLNSRIAISIIPGLPYSRKTAEKAHELGLTVMLHQPMQAYKVKRMEKYSLLKSMKSDEIKKAVLAAVAEVPYAVGVNNHEGSMATEDTRVMLDMMEVLAGKKLFFVDSMTTPKSAGAAAARRKKLPFARRNVFLDNEKDLKYIKGQIDELLKDAKKYGSAVAIGHVQSKNTLAALIDYLPAAAERAGVRIVSVKEVLKPGY